MRKLLVSLVVLLLASTIEARTLLVPAAANTAGANGTRFVTELTIVNPAAAQASITFRLITPSGVPAPASRSIVVNAGESFVIANALEFLWGLEGGGAIAIDSAAPITVRSRTFNRVASGSFGFASQPLERGRLLHTGEAGSIIWVTQSADLTRGFRTNVGVVFPDATGGSAIVDLFDSNGTKLGTRTFDFVQPAFVQESLLAFSSAAVTSGRITVTTTRGVAVAYSAVVDNVTGDSSLFLAERAPSAATDLLLGGVARTPGANATYFRSDLHWFNPNSTTTQVEVALLDGSGVNRTVNLSLAPGELREDLDVLQSLFNAADGTRGALRLRSSAGILVASRTSNVDPLGNRPGTFGSQQTATSPTDAITPAAGEVFLPAISQDSADRTNIGFTAGSAGATLRFRLFDATGAVLDQSSRALGPFAWSQENFAALFPARSSVTNGRIGVTTEAGSAALYVSSVDQLSGDSAVLAATSNTACLDTINVTIPQAACIGTSQTASVAAIDGATYTWSITGGTITSGQGTSQISFSTTTAVTLTVSVGRGSCVIGETRSLTAGATPSVSIGPTPNGATSSPVTINWTASGTIIRQTISGTDLVLSELPAAQRSFTYTPASGGTKSVTVRVFSDCGEASTSSSYLVTGPSGTFGPGSGGSGGAFPGFATFSGVSGRTYNVYTPRSYNPSEPARLVFALGGQGQPWESVMDMGWRRVADRENLIIFTMTAMTSGPGYFGAYGDAEFATIVQAETEILQRYNVALNRIYYWGFSAGAHVTYLFGLEAQRSNRVAALAIQAGALESAATRANPPSFPPQPGARRLPIFISCGTADTTGTGGGLIGALRRNATMLRDEGYPVTTREVVGMGHTYTPEEIEAAWTFLSSKSL